MKLAEKPYELAQNVPCRRSDQRQRSHIAHRRKWRAIRELVGLWVLAVVILTAGLNSAFGRSEINDPARQQLANAQNLNTLSTTSDQISRVVLQVDGVDITLGQWHEALQTAFSSRAASGQYQGGNAADDIALNTQAMHLIVDQIATDELARAQGLATDDGQLYTVWLSRSGDAGQRESEQHVADKAFVHQKAMFELRDELIRRLVPVPQVTSEQVYAFYLNNTSLFARSQPEFHVREIVTTSASTAQHVEELLASGSPFEEVARKYTMDADYYIKRGGDLGWLGVHSMPPEWVAHALRLRRGQTSPVFELWGRYYVLQGIDSPDFQPLPFAATQPEVRATLVASLQSAELDMLIAQRESTMTLYVIDHNYAGAVSDFRTSLRSEKGRG